MILIVGIKNKKGNRMENEKYVNTFFRIVKIIYAGFTLSAIVVIFISVLFWFFFNNEVRIELSLLKEILIIVFCFITIILAQSVYKKSLSKIHFKDHLNVKLQQFQMAFVFKLSLLEISLIVIATIFVLSRSIMLLFAIFILFIFIVINYPSKSHYIKLIS